MTPLFVLWHMGLGDAILCNGLIRSLADKHGAVEVPSYIHNYPAVRAMFEDDPRILVIAIKDSMDAAKMAMAKNHIALGHYAGRGFKASQFDREFYSQANVQFEKRWDGFKAPESKKEYVKPKDLFAFIHDDPIRGFNIHRDWIKLPIVSPNPLGEFFDNVPDIQNAAEVHCINSSFLILVDSLPVVEGQKLFFHRYPRPTDYPTLKKEWKLIE